MSLKPNQKIDIPAETVRVAQTIFPQGNDVMRLRDELGHLYTEEQFADLFPANGHPAQSPEGVECDRARRGREDEG